MIKYPTQPIESFDTLSTGINDTQQFGIPRQIRPVRRFRYPSETTTGSINLERPEFSILFDKYTNESTDLLDTGQTDSSQFEGDSPIDTRCKAISYQLRDFNLITIVNVPSAAIICNGKMEWLSRAVELEENGLLESALDLVYLRMDEMFLDNRFLEGDLILKDIDVNQYSRDILLTFVNVSYAANPHLPHWKEFLSRVQNSLIKRDLMEKGLLEWFKGFGE